MTQDSPLGKTTSYPDRYAPEVLHAIPRQPGRESLGIASGLPFSGTDIWNAYELSWLDPGGRPVVAAGELRVPCESPCIVESKSLKLYLSSLSGERFAAPDDATKVIAADLERIAGTAVEVRITPGETVTSAGLGELPGECIDSVELGGTANAVDPALLRPAESPAHVVAESLHTHLFRSLCPVTGQPDWASILINYRGPAIDRAGLLGYLVSYRNHGDFHEQCVERMFVDLSNRCAPAELSVYARFTRRGGIDINPFRSNFEDTPENLRLWRQ